jgi:hypothetical protein
MIYDRLRSYLSTTDLCIAHKVQHSFPLAFNVLSMRLRFILYLRYFFWGGGGIHYQRVITDFM